MFIAGSGRSDKGAKPHPPVETQTGTPIAVIAIPKSGWVEAN
jgi:hypothetical protein